MKTTKKQAQANRAEWQLALEQGRVVSYNGGLSMRAFLTVEAAQDFLRSLYAVGLSGEIAQPEDA